MRKNIFPFALSGRKLILNKTKTISSYSSAVEHAIADREVTRSNRVESFDFFLDCFRGGLSPTSLGICLKPFDMFSGFLLLCSFVFCLPKCKIKFQTRIPRTSDTTLLSDITIGNTLLPFIHSFQNTHQSILLTQSLGHPLLSPTLCKVTECRSPHMKPTLTPSYYLTTCETREPSLTHRYILVDFSCEAW